MKLLRIRFKCWYRNILTELFKVSLGTCIRRVDKLTWFARFLPSDGSSGSFWLSTQHPLFSLSILNLVPQIFSHALFSLHHIHFFPCTFFSLIWGTDLEKQKKQLCNSKEEHLILSINSIWIVYTKSKASLLNELR